MIRLITTCVVAWCIADAVLGADQSLPAKRYQEHHALHMRTISIGEWHAIQRCKADWRCRWIVLQAWHQTEV